MTSMFPLTPGNDSCLSLPGLNMLTPMRHHCKEQPQLSLLDPLGYQALGAVLPLDLLPPGEEHCSHLLIGKPVETGHTCQSAAVAVLASLWTQ